jgi:3-hydroxyisobutyrate dehydrogenase-like beta-hydroxyacid dehydrogenase
MDLLRKDLAAALDSARALGVPMLATGLAYQMYTAASGQGHGAEDYTSVSALYENSAGVRVRSKQT